MRTLALLTGVLVSAWASGDPLPGSKLSAVTLVGRDSSPAAWKPGRVTILSFFAFWCDTWKEHCPRLAKTRAALAGLPIDVVTVSVDGRWSDVPGFDPSLRCLLDRKGWAASIGVDRVPTTLVVDESGQIRWVKSGVARTEDMVREARSALRGASSGEVRLELQSFPPATGGHELLDELRRLQLHATLVLRSSYPKELERIVREAKEFGQEITTTSLQGRQVDPYDETRPTGEELVRRIVEQASPGSTVVLHAGVEVTRRTLSKIVDALRKAGLSVR
ncbi:MAG TPA: hypothetical protein VG944_20100 [Fimbriimonas sp.]|nr:hypothetical protein [Fimbriimonas sp.]